MMQVTCNDDLARVFKAAAFECARGYLCMQPLQ